MTFLLRREEWIFFSRSNEDLNSPSKTEKHADSKSWTVCEKPICVLRKIDATNTPRKIFQNYRVRYIFVQYSFKLICFYVSYPRCEDNCDSRVNPSRRLALERFCEKVDCGRGLSYQWTLFEAGVANESEWIQVSDLQGKIRTRLTSPRIVTNPRVLKPNKLYKFVLTAQRHGGRAGYSEYQFATYSSPTEGKCNVTPLSGRTLETTFTFACSGWEDPDRPLKYSFIYFTDDDFLNVVHIGMESSKKTKLPAGKKINNFTIDFRVRVADMFGAFTEVKTPVQV